MNPKVKIGIALIIIGIGAIVFYYYKSKKQKQEPNNSNNTPIIYPDNITNGELLEIVNSLKASAHNKYTIIN